MIVRYPVSGVVSAWVGRFRSESVFDTSVDRFISSRLGIGVPIESICEACFVEEEQLASTIIHGFSQSEYFLTEDALARLKTYPNMVNSAVVCYGVSIESAPPTWGPFEFMGTFAFSDR